jgi:hypothetical protein
MDTIGGSKRPQPPTASAAGENATVTAQVIEAGTTQKNDVDAAVEVHEDGTKPAKKAAGGNMKHYFVSNLQCFGRCFANACI